MNKIIYLISLLCLVQFVSAVESPQSYNVSRIPEVLTKNALAVIREQQITFEYQAVDKGLMSEKVAITILDEKGKHYAYFQYPGDKYRTLKSFSGAIYDKEGKQLRKFKKSDVMSSEWSESLATGDLHYYMTVSPSSYPCTVVFDYQIEYKNGVLSFPGFIPQNDGELSVEKSSYTLIVPTGTKIATKSFNCDPLSKVKTEKGNDIYSLRIENIEAIEDEVFMPEYHTFIPIMMARPERFVFDKVSGEINDWQSLGAWIYSLWNDRNILNEETIQKVKELVSGVSDTKEKVKILYDHLGKTTHYQNISLGIGGYQPMMASEVSRIGFGDCKGLTNYLHAMLQAVGVDSHVALVSASSDSKNIYSDYANFSQFNHVILQVPLSGDTLWIEATNAELPFGYIHNYIAGHQSLLVTKNGGIIQRLPEYADSLSLDKYVTQITIQPDGAAQATTTNENHVKIYNNYSYFTKMKYNEQVDKIRASINLSNATVTKVSFVEDKSPLPLLTINADWHTSSYGNKTGNRLFLPVNPFRNSIYNLKKKDRLFDIHITDGFKDEDIITLIIPDGYELESLPEPISRETAFGNFVSNVTLKENAIIVHQKLLINRGYWKADKYKEMTDFIESVNKAYKGQIIIRKL